MKRKQSVHRIMGSWIKLSSLKNVLLLVTSFSSTLLLSFKILWRFIIQLA